MNKIIFYKIYTRDDNSDSKAKGEIVYVYILKPVAIYVCGVLYVYVYISTSDYLIRWLYLSERDRERDAPEKSN